MNLSTWRFLIIEVLLFWKTSLSLQKNGEVITVPKGFTTDAASVPRLFWSFLPPLGRYTKAAVVHDYLYRTHLKTKEDADKIFLWLMEDLGVEKVRRIAMYYAVKLFGKKAYEK